MKRIFSYIFLFSFFFSCSPNDSETKGIKIASVGDEILFMSELEYNFPVGLNEEDSLRSKVARQEKKLKQEQYLRRKYPSVNEAYKHYLMTMKLVKSK